MKKFRGLLIFTLIVIFCSFYVFFILQQKVKVDANTKVSKTTISLDGVHGFKKGLDIAGGVKLTYKIDFSKYQQAYSDKSALELNQLKRKVEDIITKNIDLRISKLGVSDYTSRIETLNNADYLIVEIGGLKDLQEAKEIIGRTVELEFKIPNEDSNNTTIISARQQMAENLLVEVVKDPKGMKKLTEGKQSEDIYYRAYQNATISDLPEIYKSNIDAIDKLESGTVYGKLFSGVYDIQPYFQDQELVTKALNGWTIVKFNGAESKISDTISMDNLNYIGKKFGLEVETTQVKGNLDVEKNKFKYDQDKKRIVYNAGEVAQGQNAYNAKIYAMQKPNIQGLNETEAKKAQDAYEFQKNKLISDLQKGDTISITGTSLVSDGWIEESSIKNIVPNFSYNVGQTVYFAEKDGSAFVIEIKDLKYADDKLFNVVYLPIKDESKVSEIENQLKTQKLYSIEEIFVKDIPSWSIAKDPKTGEILNGAYFKYASISQSQAGQTVVSIDFDTKGGEIFCNLTEKYVGKQMAIFIGGELITSPVIRTKICGGSAQIDGNFTSQQRIEDGAIAKDQSEGARYLVDNLNSGAMPARLILSHEEKISPTLGDYAIKGSIVSALAGFAAIFILMTIMYGFTKSIISIIALCSYLIILFTIIKLTGYSLSLSGIAAIILNIGMAVDANVLLFERLREERALGKNMETAIIDGYDRSFLAIRDGNLTTGFIGLLLFVLGSNVFKGFGTMLLVNIFLTLVVVAPLSKHLLLFFYRKTK